MAGKSVAEFLKDPGVSAANLSAENADDDE